MYKFKSESLTRKKRHVEFQAGSVLFTHSSVKEDKKAAPAKKACIIYRNLASLCYLCCYIRIPVGTWLPSLRLVTVGKKNLPTIRRPLSSRV